MSTQLACPHALDGKTLQAEILVEPAESLLDLGYLVEVATLKQPPSDVKRGRLDFVLFCLLIVSSRRLASDSACTVHKHSCRCIRVSMYRC